MADVAVRRAERFIPGLRRMIEVELIATPLTLERYTSNYQGAMYGWASIPSQVGDQRFGNTIGIEGLYLAGHWSGPLGIPMVTQSGRHVADRILRNVKSVSVVAGRTSTAT